MPVLSRISRSHLEDELRLDAQYYTPANLALGQEVAAVPTVLLGTVAFITDGQHGYFKLDESSSIRQITAKCIKEGLVDKSNADPLALETHSKNLRSSLRVNDILVTTAGTIGEIGIVTDEVPPANIDQDIGRIAVLDPRVSPLFLWAFLQSRFGAFQIGRFTTGQVQTHLSLRKMKKLKIPLVEKHLEVEHLVQEFIRAKRDVACLFARIEKLLESALGLDKLNYQKPLSYTTQFSDLGLVKE